MTLDSLASLARELTAATEPLAQYDIAAAIAALGTAEAYELLVEHTVCRRPTSEACAQALSDRGDDTVPHVRSAMTKSPDLTLLVHALPGELSDTVLGALEQACAETNRPEVVFEAATRLVFAGHAALGKVRSAVAERGDPLLSGAFHLAELRVDQARMQAEIGQYLVAGATRELWSLALTVEGAAELPEARECIQRELESESPLSVLEALVAVGKHSLTELADDVLRVQMESPVPALRQMAAEILHLLADGGEGLLAETLVSECERLAEMAQSLPMALRSALRSDGPGAPVFRALAQVGRVQELIYCAVEQARPPMAALAEAARQLQDACLDLGPYCCAGNAAMVLLTVLNDLLRTLAGLPQVLTSIGVEGVRPVALSVAGRYEAEIPTPEDDPEDGEGKPAWGTVLTQLRDAAGELAGAQLAFLIPPDELPGDAAALGLGMSMAWYARLRVLVDAGRACGEAIRGEVVVALRSSSQREHHARKALLRAIGPDALAALQDTWARYPDALYHAGLEVAREAARATCRLGAQHLTTAAKLFGERNLQSALLGVLVSMADASCVPVVLGRLESECELVSDNAAITLFSIGAPALGALRDAADASSDPVLLARLLEIARCIEPAAVLETARRLVAHEDDLLATVSARIIGLAGEASDIPALHSRSESGSELLRAAVLYATAQLDAPGHVEMLKGAVTSPLCLVRATALAGLLLCPPEVCAAAEEEFASLPGRMYLAASVGLSTVESWRNRPFGPKPPTHEPRLPESFPGIRLSAPGPGPWQWGIRTLTPGSADDWLRFSDLINSDTLLASHWHVYSAQGYLLSPMLWLLRDTAVSDDCLADDAFDLLWLLLHDQLVIATSAHLERLGLEFVPEHAETTEVRAAFARALERCDVESLEDLFMKANVFEDGCGLEQGEPGDDERGEPGGEGHEWPWDEEPDETGDDGWLSELPADAALLYLFIRELTQLDGGEVAVAHENEEERRAFFEAEWEALQPYSEARLGFAVPPRFSVEDAAWYVAQPAARIDVRRGAMNYLGALAGVLPCPRRERQVAIQAISQALRPVVDRAAGTLSDIDGDTPIDAHRRHVGQSLREAIADPRGLARRRLVSMDAPIQTAEGLAVPTGRLALVPGLARCYAGTWVPWAHDALLRVQDELDSVRQAKGKADAEQGDEEDATAGGQLSAAWLVPPDLDWLFGADLLALQAEGSTAGCDVVEDFAAMATRSYLTVDGKLREAYDAQRLSALLGMPPEEACDHVLPYCGETLEHEGRSYYVADIDDE